LLLVYTFSSGVRKQGLMGWGELGGFKGGLINNLQPLIFFMSQPRQNRGGNNSFSYDFVLRLQGRKHDVSSVNELKLKKKTKNKKHEPTTTSTITE